MTRPSSLRSRIATNSPSGGGGAYRPGMNTSRKLLAHLDEAAIADADELPRMPACFRDANLCNGRHGLRPSRRFPEQQENGGREQQADRIDGERYAPAELAQRAADGNENHGRGGSKSGVERQVALALHAFEVVADERRATGHDDRLGESHP